MGINYAIFITIILCIQLTLRDCVKGNVYSATCFLKKLLNEEEKLVKALETYIKAEEANQQKIPSHIQSFFNSVEETNSAAIADQHYTEHPINAFHLIYRVASKWPSVFNDIWWQSVSGSEHAKDFNASMSEAKQSGVWPTSDDITGSVQAILRLGKCYQLDVKELFAGRIRDTQTTPLSYDDVITICKYAEASAMYYDIIVWLENYMVYRANDSSYTDSMKIESTKILANAYHKYGMPWKSLEILETFLPSGEPGILDTYNYIKPFSDKINPEARTKRVEYKQDSVGEMYDALCRGDVKVGISVYLIDSIGEMYDAICRGDAKTIEERSTLKCFLRKTKIPYYRSKEEVVNYTPRVSLFHDVISDKEIAYLRSEALKKLHRSMVVSNNGSGSVSDESRVSNTAWLHDKEHDMLPTLARRVGIVTGLNTEFKDKQSDVEQFQILNYGIGGMYRPHHDYIRIPLWGPPYEHDPPQMKGSGDRIATWMFYLTDVKAGGATVFPHIKSRVPVVKGAAAFWFNIKPSGDLDYKTLHAGCPVLLGSKWASNKWIRESGQVFTRLCGYSRISTDDLPIV